MYSTRTRVNMRIPNGHPREEKRASGQKSADKSASWTGRERRGTACRCARRTRRLPREDPRTEVGEEVGVGVRVCPVEFSHIRLCTERNTEVDVRRSWTRQSGRWLRRRTWQLSCERRTHWCWQVVYSWRPAHRDTCTWSIGTRSDYTTTNCCSTQCIDR